MSDNQSQATLQSPFDLLEETKHALAITWDEEDKDIIKLIDRSIYFMNNLVGVELDLDVNLSARELVINRIRYEYNNALDEFEDNYRQPLSRLILHVAIDERKESNGD
ncbi:hypothetical protein COD67_22760 [Bacillus cereus]|nr:hypothetical protein COI89_02020 [Bacillus cereus]PGU62644.1 hypothetical protein COD67_22760 [Bacillus cereus]